MQRLVRGHTCTQQQAEAGGASKGGKGVPVRVDVFKDGDVGS